MGLGNAKIYGGVGGILSLIGPLAGSFGLILSIAGLVLVFLAVKTISDETGDERIFSLFLKAFISMVAGLIIFIIVIIATVGSFAFGMIGKGMMSPGNLMAVIGSILVGFLILWITYIIGTYFQKKSFELIAEYTGVNLFKTTGLVYFIGAILIIIGVGFLIILVGAILEIVSFFSLPEEAKKLETPVSP
ncbi:hypothetical protein PNA2_1899 [Pyrococcus sp. NA2]|uniref:DUF996 domain-containing protein n=1 Tax=Pyrococcus sp. (strain NA2) TaxID=342949 RepID=UPI000209ACFE|nr:DUF996 domain-containing protein [Pyrococcus sp. NA2]AEC52812.1 hypothetical protein PNA2_1899 [Pyrococcus sp. NA2]